MRILRFVVPALVSLLLASDATAADDNPAVQACAGKAKGDACTFKSAQKEGGGALTERDQSGTCQDDKCCELDYSKGSPPTSNCGPCLACKSDGSTPPSADAGGEAASAGPNQESPRTGDDPPATPGNGKRGCSIGSGDAEWALLVLIPFIAARRGRRCRVAAA